MVWHSLRDCYRSIAGLYQRSGHGSAFSNLAHYPRHCRQGFIITALSDSVWMITLTFVGVALSVFFRSRQLPDWVAVNTINTSPISCRSCFRAARRAPWIRSHHCGLAVGDRLGDRSSDRGDLWDFYSRLVKGRRSARSRTPRRPSSECRFDSHGIAGSVAG